MKSPFVFSLLRIGSKVLFYLLAVYTLVFVITPLLRISGKNEKINGPVFTYEALSFNPPKQMDKVSSETKTIRLKAYQNRYEVTVMPASGMGYYAFLSKLLFTFLGVLILWIFKRIFEQANVQSPFLKSIHKLLLLLAAVFLVADVLAMIDYQIVNQMLSAEVPALKLRLVTELGRGATTALIILAIATIYHRGIVMQEENDLTV